MKQTDCNSKQMHSFQVWLGVAATMLLCLGLFTLFSTSASASYEQVGTFAGSAAPVVEGEFAEEVQLGGVGGMAVNINGAGGVPAGTVYAITTRGSGGSSVAMFTPKPNGGLRFAEGWNLTSSGGPYERCGPEGELPSGELVHPSCPVAVQELPVGDVDVDQTTGNVYVHNSYDGKAGVKQLVVYSPDGAEEIARFGEKAAVGETVAESPGKIHQPGLPGGIAVNGAGDVYLYDSTSLVSFYHRLMVFKPQSPGDYEHYVYAGEVAAGPTNESLPTKPVVDAMGNIYVVSGLQDGIEMYAPEAPASFPGHSATAICTFDFSKGGIESITVDPQSGEVFFSSYKAPKRVRRLGPCDEETGKFTELTPEPEAFAVAPERGDLAGLAFDPERQLEASRAPGVLYGGAQGGEPGSGVGKGEPGQSSLGYIFAHSKELAPEIQAQSVAKVTATGAVLRATINPNSFPTHYALQYITEDAYEANPPGERFAGASEAPLGGGEMEGVQGGQSVAVTVGGLNSDTAYRYRAVATSNCAESEPAKICEDAGEAQSFRTFPLGVPGLPDGRAYEMVSPAQKNGGQVFPAAPSIGVCPAFDVCKPGNNNFFFPRQSAPGGEAIVYEGTPFDSVGAVVENQYIARRDAVSGWQTTNLSPTLLQSKREKGYQAFDAELTVGVLAQSSPSLSPDAPPGYENLYLQPTAGPLSLSSLMVAAPPHRSSAELELHYAGASADLSRIFFEANDALTAQTPFAPGAADGGADDFNLYEWESATAELTLVNVAPGNIATATWADSGAGGFQAVSEDGSRAFWTDQGGQLYVREDSERTLEIPVSGEFLSAATDGSKVLLDDGEFYDLEAEATTDLTAGKGGFEGIVGQSDDLSRVYFVDTEVLDEEPNEEGDNAEAGEKNLYAWSGGSTRYVATLAAQDNTPTGINDGNGDGSGDWNPSPPLRTAQASPSGRWLAFLSQVELTGYDNVGPCQINNGNVADLPCSQAFLYDSQTGELRCASCNPSGTNPLGRTFLREGRYRYLTDSGRLYFDSRDSLSPFDTNEGVEDVYEYEPSGVGSCKRPDGCLSLISAGTGVADSNLLTIDESGKNVFFTTRDQLTLRDSDELIDLYDAREGGGIPGETEASDGECQGEACQPAPVAPNDPTPGSASFQGSGNVKQGKAKPRCAKGRKQVRRKGKTRCVKRHHNRSASRNHGGAK